MRARRVLTGQPLTFKVSVYLLAPWAAGFNLLVGNACKLEAFLRAAQTEPQLPQLLRKVGAVSGAVQSHPILPELKVEGSKLTVPASRHVEPRGMRVDLWGHFAIDRARILVAEGGPHHRAGFD